MHIEDLRDKVCLITGASQGIGAAAARGLAAAGLRVGVHYHRSAAAAAAVAGDIAAAGGEAFLLHGDIREHGTVERLIREIVDQYGSLSILINNAGDLIERHPAAETSDEMFDQHVALNMRPVFAGCRAAVRQFRAQGHGGGIINLSSVAARTGGGGGSSLYAASKAFVATFTRALAKEVAPEGIRVNAVSPGVIATPMQDRTTPREAQEAVRRMIPMGRIGAADECVGAFLYLCSERLSGYVTGQMIEVNGGLAMP
ncbi:MAG TPA: SDR family NAD(P)-dependent oxidoreductase [Acetobacteraceae bacterium]|nr:SDR family NAD(P)-dependent oxidoreductase [Acetobacteraceae bacterium]